MARTNKYASLNFNDIYDKKNNNKTLNNNNNPTSSLNKTKITNSHIHGNMLVLTRPTPKPISSSSPSQAQAHTQAQPPPPQHQQSKQPNPFNPDPTRLTSESDSISLRPLGSTGGSAAGVSRLPRDLCFVSPKPEKFVPPHLRPGYVCKEEKPVSPVKNRQRQFGEEGSRPKSGGGGGGGGGYDRMRRGSSGTEFVFRPGYTRPNSSG